MFKTKQNTTPAIFQQKFKTINHKYPTKFSFSKFDFLYLPEVQRFGINFVTMEQKRLPLFPSFKIQLKTNY